LRVKEMIRLQSPSSSVNTGVVASAPMSDRCQSHDAPVDSPPPGEKNSSVTSTSATVSRRSCPRNASPPVSVPGKPTRKIVGRSSRLVVTASGVTSAASAGVKTTGSGPSRSTAGPGSGFGMLVSSQSNAVTTTGGSVEPSGGWSQTKRAHWVSPAVTGRTLNESWTIVWSIWNGSASAAPQRSRVIGRSPFSASTSAVGASISRAKCRRGGTDGSVGSVRRSSTRPACPAWSNRRLASGINPSTNISVAPIGRQI
jgi:hypothetical protein